MSEIARRIRAIAERGTEIESRICLVTAVDEQARTVDCEPLDESAPILGVNLQANQEQETGVVIYPKVGSHVIVSMMSGGTGGCVIATEEVDHIEVAIGELRAKIDSELARVEIGMMSAELSREGIVLNGGHHGGLVKVEALTGRLNAIERDINELKRAMGGWTPAPQDGGAALKGAIATWVGAELTETVRGDYENEQVKQ